jgi:hypothetical protein
MSLLDDLLNMPDTPLVRQPAVNKMQYTVGSTKPHLSTPTRSVKRIAPAQEQMPHTTLSFSAHWQHSRASRFEYRRNRAIIEWPWKPRRGS